MRNIVENSISYSVQFPCQQAIADESLHRPEAKVTSKRTRSPKAAKLIGAGMTVTGAAMAIYALARAPGAMAQYNVQGPGSFTNPNDGLRPDMTIHGVEGHPNPNYRFTPRHDSYMPYVSVPGYTPTYTPPRIYTGPALSIQEHEEMIWGKQTYRQPLSYPTIPQRPSAIQHLKFWDVVYDGHKKCIPLCSATETAYNRWCTVIGFTVGAGLKRAKIPDYIAPAGIAVGWTCNDIMESLLRICRDRGC